MSKRPRQSSSETAQAQLERSRSLPVPEAISHEPSIGDRLDTFQFQRAIEASSDLRAPLPQSLEQELATFDPSKVFDDDECSVSSDVDVVCASGVDAKLDLDLDFDPSKVFDDDECSVSSDVDVVCTSGVDANLDLDFDWGEDDERHRAIVDVLAEAQGSRAPPGLLHHLTQAVIFSLQRFNGCASAS